MKKRIKELAAFLLAVCMAFGSVGATGYAATEGEETDPVSEEETDGLNAEEEAEISAEGGPYYVVYNYNYPASSGLTEEKKEVELPADAESFTIGENSGRENVAGYEFINWGGYTSNVYTDDNSVDLNKFITDEIEAASGTDTAYLNANWSQIITVTVDGEETTPVLAGNSISAPVVSDPEYTVEWKLNGSDFSYAFTPGHSKTGHVTELSTPNAYNITKGNPVAAFVSYWTPENGKLIQIVNNTGSSLSFDSAAVDIGASYLVGIVSEDLAELSSGKTSDGKYRIQVSADSVPEDAAGYNPYDGKDNVTYYQITLEPDDLQRIVSLTFQGGSDVDFKGSDGTSYGNAYTVADTDVADGATIESIFNGTGISAERSGYSLSRWKYTDENGTELDPSNPLKEDFTEIICTPVWSATINFKTNYPEEWDSGPSLPSRTEEDGGSISLELLDGDERYQLLGWAASPDAAAPEYTETYTVDGNATLYGVWSAREYTLIWTDRESTEYNPIEGNYTVEIHKTETIAYGDQVVTPPDPEKPGYVFLGWNGYNNGKGITTCDPTKSYSQSNPFPDTASMPYYDAEIAADWEPVVYELSYDGNGAGMGVPSELLENLYYGDQVSLPTLIPTRTGYTFEGWEYGGTVYPAGSMFTVPEAEYNEAYKASLTLTAAWKPNRHLVSYDGAGATSGVPESYEADYNSTVTAGAGPVRDGYVFEGWEQISTGKVIGAGVTFIMPDMDETLKAMWKIAWSRFGGAGRYYLVSGQPYSLDFKAKVEGDEGQYESGIIFYVPSSGYYTFTE